LLVDFKGSIDAKEVTSLREEITAILSVASAKDEVFVRLESGGGMVHGYGLAASQLQRLKDNNIPLTISVDKVAASGGYMMACIADKIIAAPFAILGSIGVIAQIPNFNKLLKKHPQIDIDKIATGEHWYGLQAIDRALVDKISTSDDYLVSQLESRHIIQVKYSQRKKLSDKLGHAASIAVENTLLKLMHSNMNRFF